MTDDTPELFGAAWAAGWCRELSQRPEYRQAAAGWEGAIAFVMTAEPAAGVPATRAVVADLWHGECRGSRPAADGDLEAVPFVLEAPPAVWRQVLIEGKDPLWAVMSGQLKLARGSLGALVPYAQAAKEMVAAARAVPAALPPGWESA